MKPQISSIDRIRTRPRFKLYTYLSPEEYAENLKKYIKEHQEEFSANINREMATISVKAEENDFYKPFLTIRTEKEDKRTIVRGIFGPSSAVWTFFVFLYALFGTLWMVFITFWFVGKQIKSEDYNWGLPLSFVMLLMIGLTYIAARYGQNKAKREMVQLRRFAIESTLPFEEELNEDEN